MSPKEMFARYKEADPWLGEVAEYIKDALLPHKLLKVVPSKPSGM